jgi:hypothetical protein
MHKRSLQDLGFCQIAAKMCAKDPEGRFRHIINTY